MLFSFCDIADQCCDIENVPETRQKTFKYFRYFLDELNIPYACFKKKNNQWAFDENGKALFLEVIYSSKPKVKSSKKQIYTDIRNGIFSAEYSTEYRWILSCIVSNFNSLSTSGNISDTAELSEEKIRERFWGKIICGTNMDYSVLPGVSWLSDAIQPQELDDLIKRSDLCDIIYIDYIVQEEFEKLYDMHIAAYQADYERTAKKWQAVMNSMLQHREEACVQMEKVLQNFSRDSLLEISRSFSKEPTYTAGKDFSHAKARAQEREKYLMELCEDIVGFYLCNNEKFPCFPKKLSSQDLFEEITKTLYPQKENSKT